MFLALFVIGKTTLNCRKMVKNLALS